MKNRHITHAHQQAEMYSAYYRPSINPLRFCKSILSVLLFGNGPVAHSYFRPKNKTS